MARPARPGSETFLRFQHHRLLCYNDHVPVPGKRNELLVGLFLFIGLILLGGLIVQFGRFEEYFGKEYRFTIVFDDASGLIKGSEVRMGGARIGRVAKLPELTESVQVEVELAIDENTRIPLGSSFQIDSATLLGDKLIVIIPPAKMSGYFVEPDAHIIGSGPTGFSALQNQAHALSGSVSRFLDDADTTLRKVDAAVDEIKAASEQLGTALDKVNRSVLAEGNLTRFDETMANLSAASARWKDTSDKLEPTLGEAREAIASIKTAAERTGRTLESVDAAVAGIDPAVKNISAAAAGFTATTTKANLALDRMNRGEGMLGAFASDNDVAFDFKAFMNNLRRHGIILYRNDAGQDAAPEAEAPPKPGMRRIGGKWR